MKISIVSVNYNGADDSIALADILKNQTDADFDFVLVDNGSEVGDIEKLNRYQTEHGWDRLFLMKNGENLGFSGGCNAGIKKALENSSKWVILLNNDTMPDRGFVASIKAVLGAKSGVISIPLGEGSKIAYSGLIKWLKTTLIHNYQPQPYKGALCTKGTFVGEKMKDFSHLYAIGGGVAIEKGVFDKIGLWDENYFLYFEDADFSIRAQRAGFDFSIAESIVVPHKISASTKKLGSPLLLRYHHRNALYFNRKLGPWWIKILLWPWSVWIIKKQIFKLAIGIQKNQSRAILAGAIDFYKNKMGKIN